LSTRVSTLEQDEALQHDALIAAGCQRVFVDKASGEVEHRPALDAAEFAGPRSTTVWYSNAIVFHRARVLSSGLIAAHTSLDDRDAVSSQRGGQGFESPQLHRRSKALSQFWESAFLV